jgi:tetratricopeptide (TPR) repeat protein
MPLQPRILRCRSNCESKLWARVVSVTCEAAVCSCRDNADGVALRYNLLGHVYRALKQYNIALEKYQESLRIYERKFGVGTTHELIAVAMANTAKTLLFVRRYDDALKMMNKALAMFVSLFGAER